MQVSCHRCGEALPEGSGETPFCPHCGSPQLTLSLENQSVETGGEPQMGADGLPTTGTLPPPRPRQVEWKTAIRCAALVAAIGCVLSLGARRVDVLWPVSFLWVMSASLITLGLYHKRRPAAWLDVRVGAHIGLVVGLCLALGLGISMASWGLLGRFALHSMGGFDAWMTSLVVQLQKVWQEKAAEQQVAISPGTLGLFASQEFRAGVMLFYFGLGSVFLLVTSTLGGAFAGLMRMQRRRVA